MEKLWPALTSVQHSEKPSIIKLFDWISDSVFHGVDTFAIELELTEDVCLSKAMEVWEAGSPLKPMTATGISSFPSDDERANGLAKLKADNSANMKSYLGIIDTLCDQVKIGSYHCWHFVFVQYTRQFFRITD
jgi:hypothetical protein